jgi:hypothetical protein
MHVAVQRSSWRQSAFDAHIISEKFYVDLVLLALVTSMMAGAWLDRVLRRGTFFAELLPQTGDDDASSSASATQLSNRASA